MFTFNINILSVFHLYVKAGERFPAKADRVSHQVLLRKWYSYVLLILIKTRRQEYLWSYSFFQSEMDRSI